MEDNSKGDTKMVASQSELNARIEANLPLVKHVVFQVAVAALILLAALALVLLPTLAEVFVEPAPPPDVIVLPAP